MLELCLRYAHPDSVAPPEIPFRGILDPVARKLRLPFRTPDFIEIHSIGVDVAETGPVL